MTHICASFVHAMYCTFIRLHRHLELLRRATQVCITTRASKGSTACGLLMMQCQQQGTTRTRSRAGLPAKPVGPVARIIAQMTNPMRIGSTMLLYIPYEGWYRYCPLQGDREGRRDQKSSSRNIRAGPMCKQHTFWSEKHCRSSAATMLETGKPVTNFKAASSLPNTAMHFAGTCCCCCCWWWTWC